MKGLLRDFWLVLVIGILSGSDSGAADGEPQYKANDIVVSAATAEEPKRSEFSIDAARQYLADGANGWVQSRKCISCHTTGIYLQMWPAMSEVLGSPDPGMRDFFVDQLGSMSAQDPERLRSGIRPTQIAYLAQGLAEWDANIDKKLSAETSQALDLMLQVQSDDGSWGNTECWPPFESSSYHGATVAAQALAAAPGFLQNMNDQQLQKVERLKAYLRTRTPPHDYGRLLLLWTSMRLPGVMEDEAQQEAIRMLWRHQRTDGGWSIRTFSQPEDWGNGSRASKLRKEPEFDDPPSDGHQTGLVVLVLREAGIPADDPRIQKAVEWLKSNQRESGRWWTRSLNTDRYHFITYSGTFYPLMALHRCDALD